jgi:hypothetical protein
MRAGIGLNPDAVDGFARPQAMTTDFSSPFGFQAPSRECARKRRRIVFAELLLALSLALSTVISLTAVSIGMAHERTMARVSDAPDLVRCAAQGPRTQSR